MQPAHMPTGRYYDQRFRLLCSTRNDEGPPKSRGRGWTDYLLDGCPPPRFFILGQSADLPSSKPELGAECLNWACSDLCRGRPAMGVPTAIRRANANSRAFCSQALLRL